MASAAVADHTVRFGRKPMRLRELSYEQLQEIRAKTLLPDDVRQTVQELEARGAKCAPVEQARWGQFTTIEMPSGACVGLYQPSHPTAI